MDGFLTRPDCEYLCSPPDVKQWPMLRRANTSDRRITADAAFIVVFILSQLAIKCWQEKTGYHRVIITGLGPMLCFHSQIFC